MVNIPALLACFKRGKSVYDVVHTAKTKERLYCPECGAHRHGKIMKKEMMAGKQKNQSGKQKVNGKRTKFSMKCRCQGVVCKKKKENVVRQDTNLGNMLF